MTSLRRVSIGLASLTALTGGATWAGEADRPLAIAGGFETWRLPGAERLGMVHAEVLFEVAPAW